MTTNNQQLKLEVEKLKNQVKAADEGEGVPEVICLRSSDCSLTLKS